ncbi:MAG: hypothetical protein Q8N05_06025 [Bacteroidota bacterium]|nr:hypothetical protein [Bacteroidota bacterium]
MLVLCLSGQQHRLSANGFTGLVLFGSPLYGIQLVGRNDHSSGRGHQAPKPLAELLSGIDLDKPVIVMNHQPFNLNEAAEANVDLHLSGHTHNGQLWPFNYLTEAIFELSWGLIKKGNTNFYVSSGYGTWGPPVRIGNRPEVVVF